LEEALDLSFDRLLMMMTTHKYISRTFAQYEVYDIVHLCGAEQATKTSYFEQGDEPP